MILDDGSWSRRRFQTTWTEARKKLLADLRATGVPNREIARRLGISVDAMQAVVRRMGLAPRKGGGKPGFVPQGTFWTPERTKHVVDLWAEGLSASETAAAIGAGCTRNMVISKVHRLKLPRRKTTVAKKAPGGRPVGFKPPKRQRRMSPPLAPRVLPVVRPPPVRHDAPPSLDIPLSDISPHQCHHIAGEPVANALMCGHPTVNGGRWCAYHHGLVYRPTYQVERQEEAA